MKLSVLTLNLFLFYPSEKKKTKNANTQKTVSLTQQIDATLVNEEKVYQSFIDNTFLYKQLSIDSLKVHKMKVIMIFLRLLSVNSTKKNK